MSSALAATEPSSPFQVLPGQRILLEGDSIVKGYGFGNYTNPSPLRTLDGIANILLKDNLPYPPKMSALPSIWKGLNPDGTPKTVDTMAGEIQVNVRRGNIRTGDWLIYEDAGELDKVKHPAPWPDAKNMYGRMREALRGMLLETENSIGRDHVLMMTMFDYCPKIPWCEWDAPLDDGLHTGNDAIRDEAAAQGVRVLDMNRIMDKAVGYIEINRWGRLVGPDGIHPNVYGNYVMTLAILGALGANIAEWKLDGLLPHFRHPANGGDVESVWGFSKDPTDSQRKTILTELRHIVATELKDAVIEPPQPAGKSRSAAAFDIGHSFTRFIRHGRVLDHPPVQPEGTTKAASYELGKLFQLDGDSVLLAVSLREQGGQDFEIGNDGFIFRHLSDIVPARAIPLTRLDPNYTMKSGKKAVLSKYPLNGTIVPLGAKLADGRPHPGAGTGFLFSSVVSFTPDRAQYMPDPDEFLEFYQVRWDGQDLKLTPDRLPEQFSSRLKDVAFNTVAQDVGFITPFGSADGMQALRFDYTNQVLDGSIYLTTNTGPGWLRNPLLAFTLRGQTFVNPITIHDEKQIGDDKHPECPFVDHGIGANVFFEGRWRHLICYRVCDLRETNGDGAPPKPQTGLYLAELEFPSVSYVPFHF